MVGVVGVVVGVRVRVERNKEQGQIGSTTILQPLRLLRPLLLLIPNNKCNKCGKCHVWFPEVPGTRRTECGSNAPQCPKGYKGIAAATDGKE